MNLWYVTLLSITSQYVDFGSVINTLESKSGTASPHRNEALSKSSLVVVELMNKLTQHLFVIDVQEYLHE